MKIITKNIKNPEYILFKKIYGFHLRLYQIIFYALIIEVLYIVFSSNFPINLIPSDVSFYFEPIKLYLIHIIKSYLILEFLKRTFHFSGKLSCGSYY